MDQLRLASEFDAPTRDDWMAAVERIIKGADFDRTLVRRTSDGLDIEPMYGPGTPPERPPLDVPHRPHGRWDIRVSVPLASPDVVSELENGATSVEMFGTGDLTQALDGVLFDLAPISLDTGADVFDDARVLSDLIGDADSAGGCLGADPLSHLARHGWWPHPPRADELVNDPRLSNFRVVRASGAPINEAGGSEAQELAWILACAVSYLEELNAEAGLDFPAAAARIELDVTADVDVFLTIAKLRALRWCWATVLESIGAPDAPVHVTARSAEAPLTVVDPWVNLLRGTAACFGAVVGGADSVIVAAFDGVDIAGGPLGRRLARNTQLLLQEESALGFVADPAGGSWFVEDLTQRLAQTAWGMFQDIQSRGGADEYLASGELGRQVEAVANARQRRIDTRRRAITGVSEFPLLDERRPPVSDAADAPARPDDPLVTAPALPGRRYADAFEALRLAADGAEPRPTVWIEALGSPAAHTPRVTFTVNALAAGGIASTLSTTGGELTESGCQVAVICGAQPDYEAGAVDAVQRMRDAGAEHVYVAGAPGDLDAELRAAGVDGFLVLGGDLVEFLTTLHQQLAVAS